MTSSGSDFLAELEESAQGQDLFRAPGSEQLLAQSRDQAEASGWLPPRVVETWPVDDPRTKVAQRRQRLLEAMRQLESATARASRQADWLEVVTEASQNLQSALGDHIDQTEGAGGFLEDLVSQAPRLATDAKLLESDHRALLNDCERLASVTRSSPDDARAIRKAVLVLLGRLVEHRQRGAELLYDAYNVELGDGD